MGSQRKRSKNSNDKYDYKSIKSIYEGGKQKSYDESRQNSKRASSNRPTKFEDEPKVFNFEEPNGPRQNNITEIDLLSDKVVHLPEEKRKPGKKLMN